MVLSPYSRRRPHHRSRRRLRNRRVPRPRILDVDVVTHLARLNNDPGLYGGAAGYAALDEAFADLRAALSEPTPEVQRLLTIAENSALDLASDRHDAGIRFGVSAEMLRRALLEESRTD